MNSLLFEFTWVPMPLAACSRKVNQFKKKNQQINCAAIKKNECPLERKCQIKCNIYIWLRYKLRNKIEKK